MQKAKIKDVQRFISSLNEEITYKKEMLQPEEHPHNDLAMAQRTYVAKAESLLNDINELFNAMFSLRAVVKTFNVSHIESKLAVIARLQLQRNTIEEVFQTGTGTVRTSSYSGNSVREGCTVGYRDTLRSTMKKLDREIREAKDACSYCNTTHTVEISDEVVSVLKKYELLG